MTIRTAALLTRLASFFAVSLVALQVQAQPLPIDTIDPEETVERINAASVGAALSVVVGNQIESIDTDGSPKLIATATNGLQFEVRFRACDANLVAGETEPPEPRHCMGILLISVWDALPQERRSEFHSIAATFLRDHPASNAGKLDDGSPYLVRYVIADHGMKQGNLVSEFANFIRSATEYQNLIAARYSN